MAAPRSDTTFAITGAAGGIGRHLVRALRDAGDVDVRALVHKTRLPPDLLGAGVTAHAGSLEDRTALGAWLSPGCIVVHLAHAEAAGPTGQDAPTARLADACADAGVSRVVHVSTTAVYGRGTDRVITEDSPCRPSSPHARHKYAIEEQLERAARGRFPLVIARPTSVFGPGLRNLVSLASTLGRRPSVGALARVTLAGSRQLHLVPVDTVVAALRFLAVDLAAPPLAGPGAAPRFVISSDTEAGGHYHAVAARLRPAMGLAPWKVPALPVPSGLLRALLAFTGRGEDDPERIYDGSRLLQAGFRPPISRNEGLDRFGAWWRSARGG